MKSTPLWNGVLVACVWSFMILRKAHVVGDYNYSVCINIDCGVTQENFDENRFQCLADDAEFGHPYKVSPKCSFNNNNNKEQIGKQMNTRRKFPQGKRNCYSLTPKQGKNNNYLIKAYFAYDNNKSSAPKFDLHIGVNFWTTIDWNSAGGRIYREGVLQLSPTSNIDVCLINTGHGVPSVSRLELWPLRDSIYRDDSTYQPLDLLERNSLGLPQDRPYLVRYPDDAYGTAWFNKQVHNSEPFSTSEGIDKDTSVYSLPKEMLSTAIRSRNNGSFSLDIDLMNYSADYDYYVYLHFFDFEWHPQNQLRSMNIVITDTIKDHITLHQPKTLRAIVKKIPKGVSFNHISITSSQGSSLPPMINAYEVYRVLPQRYRSTKEEDVDAMRKIKDAYATIRKISWQGYPCMPQEYEWEGVTCNYSKNIPRVTKLNLSSSKLKGEITTAFSNPTRLESSDLSNNQLTGEIPKSLAERLPNLELPLDGNPDIFTRSCKTITKKFIIAITTSVAAFVALLIIYIICVLLYKRRRNTHRGIFSESAWKFLGIANVFCATNCKLDSIALEPEQGK